MKKKVLLLAIVFAFAAMFIGCGANSASVSTTLTYNSDEDGSSGSYVIKFNKKEGQDIHSLNVEEESSVLFKFDAMVKKGEISFKIETNEGKIVYESSGKTISFNESFNLEEGIYIIVFDFDEVSRGSVKLEMHSDNPFSYCNSVNNNAAIES